MVRWVVVCGVVVVFGGMGVLDWLDGPSSHPDGPLVYALLVLAGAALGWRSDGVRRGAAARRVDVIPHNPYIFVALLVLAAVGPVVSADAPGVGIPPWVPYLLSVLNVAGAVVLKAMQPPVAEPTGSTVDDLLPALEALTVEERAELSARLELRATRRGEG